MSKDASRAWSRALATVFLLDGALALGFGAASWATPHGTFGTILDLAGAGDGSLVIAALGALSGFYVLVGAMCVLVALLPSPFRERFVLPVVASHLWTGFKGLQDIGRDWLIGNPWPDIVIHASFVAAYLLATAGLLYRKRAGAPPPR